MNPLWSKEALLFVAGAVLGMLVVGLIAQYYPLLDPSDPSLLLRGVLIRIADQIVGTLAMTGGVLFLSWVTSFVTEGGLLAKITENPLACAIFAAAVALGNALIYLS